MLDAVGRKVKVLKKRTLSINAEDQERILEELIQNGKIKPRQIIDYPYFIELYKPYMHQITELDFAKLLEIPTSIYREFIKINKMRTRVLKTKPISIDEQENILQELLMERKLHYKQVVDYEYLNELYIPYSEQMTLQEFANVLGISNRTYNNIKYERTKHSNIN